MKELVDQYEKGIESLRDATRGLGAQDMRAVPQPDWNAGQWTISQIVVHLQDAETAFADRIRRIVAQDNPALLVWDENKFIERLHYDDQSAEDAIELIALIRRQLTRVLRKMSADDFKRVGQHSEAGQQAVTDVLGKAVWHLEHHLKFVRKKRALLGKPL